MARLSRVEFPGALYHVTARGVAHQSIFFDDRDRLRFLDLLGRTHERHGFVFRAYCLMANHYHQEVETPEGNLSQGMQWLGQSYASFVNRRHGRVGHLFQGRFKAVLVQQDAYLHILTRYIHLNPVRAKLVKHPAQYPWSSYRAYLGATRSPAWLETEATLSCFGPTVQAARAAYRRFVEDEPAADPLRDLRFGLVLGGDAFVKQVCKLVSAAGKDWLGPNLRRAEDRPSVEDVMARVCAAYEVSESQLRTKHRRNNEPRDVAIYLCSRLAGVGLRVIGDRLGDLGASAVSMACRRIRQRMERDDVFAERVRAIAVGVTSSKFNLGVYHGERRTRAGNQD